MILYRKYIWYPVYYPVYNMEYLGKEFTDILFDNIWDLYET